jgi:hypothetical protein
VSPTEDYAIWLYGSRARGDADDASDVDLLLLGGVPECDVVALRREYGRNLSLSEYTWEEIDAMVNYGSVFLHHVGREGRPLVEHGRKAEEFMVSIKHLPPYRFASRDLSAFRSSVDDVRGSMCADGSASYELMVLATTIRHAAILGCYVEGDITFGRSEPLAKLAGTWGLDQRWVERFAELYGFVLHGQRSEPVPWDPDACDTHVWADFADHLLDGLEVSIAKYKSQVSEAA